MNEYHIAALKPEVGQRILIDTGKEIVGAILLSYLRPDWLYYLTDRGEQLPVEVVERWWEMPN